MPDIDAMPAGREMDYWVAINVMGWEHVNGKNVYFEGRPNEYFTEWSGWQTPKWKHILTEESLHKFSTDITAAWELQAVDPFTVAPYPNGTWHASNGTYIAFGETMPLALCRAKLKKAMAE